MSDKINEIREDSEIDINNSEELKDWSEFFRVEEGSLIAAVKFVGLSSRKVKKFLGK